MDLGVSRAGGGTSRTVAVVGGGIAGLAAAWELTGGSAGPGPSTPRVVVLEAADRVGGKIRTESFEGGPVDLGPDGFLGRRPEAADLCRELGLSEALRPIGTAGAAVFARGRRRPLPDGLFVGIPTRFWPVARSGVLGPKGSLRLLLDVVAPRPDSRGPLGDRAVGPLVARKLGGRVVEVLVDPLMGGIHAGGVGDMSTAASYPLLLALAQRRGSFMRSLRQALARGAAGAPVAATDDGDGDHGDSADDADGGDAPATEAPLFYSLEGGLERLTDRLAAVLAERDVEIRTESPVELLDRTGPGWVLHTPEGPVVADGLVLALPASGAAALLEGHDAEAGRLLAGIEYASVSVLTFAFSDGVVPTDELYGTGLLVPHGTAVPARRSDGDDPVGVFSDDDSFLVTACTYLSQKWPHLERPGSVLIRASVGRADDERAAVLSDAQLVERVLAELRILLGVAGRPQASAVTRWKGAFPQYRVHHLLRVTGIESALRRLPATAVAGASYRGVGIPACVASGRAAATTVLDAMAEQPSEAGPG